MAPIRQHWSPAGSRTGAGALLAPAPAGATDECRLGARVWLHGLRGKLAALDGQRATVMRPPSTGSDDRGPEGAARCLVETDSGERAQVAAPPSRFPVRCAPCRGAQAAPDGSPACCARLRRCRLQISRNTTLTRAPRIVTAMNHALSALVAPSLLCPMTSWPLSTAKAAARPAAAASTAAARTTAAPELRTASRMAAPPTVPA